MSFKINKKIKAVEESGELVLLNMKNGKFYGLDEIGTQVWRMIEDGKKLDDIVHAMHDTYPAVPEAQLRTDMGRLLEQLQGAKLIK